jgi:hypothetical protein
MNQREGPKTEPCEKPGDIRGAEAIAEYIFGDRRHRRKVYHLAESSKIPIWRLGSTLCLRPSTYEAWIKDQEARVTKGQSKEV